MGLGCIGMLHGPGRWRGGGMGRVCRPACWDGSTDVRVSQGAGKGIGPRRARRAQRGGGDEGAQARPPWAVTSPQSPYRVRGRLLSRQGRGGSHPPPPAFAGAGFAGAGPHPGPRIEYGAGSLPSRERGEGGMKTARRWYNGPCGRRQGVRESGRAYMSERCRNTLDMRFPQCYRPANHV